MLDRIHRTLILRAGGGYGSSDELVGRSPKAHRNSFTTWLADCPGSMSAQTWAAVYPSGGGAAAEVVVVVVPASLYPSPLLLLDLTPATHPATQCDFTVGAFGSAPTITPFVTEGSAPPESTPSGNPRRAGQTERSHHRTRHPGSRFRRRPFVTGP